MIHGNNPPPSPIGHSLKGRLKSGTLLVVFIVVVGSLWEALNQSPNLNVLAERADQAGEAEDFLEQEQLLQLLLDEQDRKLGSRHTNLISTLHSLGMVLDRKGDTRGAELAYRRALVISDHNFTEPRDLMESRNRLGSFYFDHGNFDAAEMIFQIGMRAELDDRPDCKFEGLLFVRNLVAVHIRRKEHEKAKQLLSHALPLIERKAGAHSHDVTRLMILLAHILDELAEHDAAEVVLRDAHSRSSEASPVWPNTIHTQIALLGHFRRTGQDAKHKAGLAALLRLSQANWHPVNVDTLFGQESLAFALSELGEHQSAVEIQTRVVREFEQLPEDSHPGMLPKWREHVRDSLIAMQKKADGKSRGGE